MLTAGVSKSQVLRALASAWEWLAKVPPHHLMGSQRSLSLVFARLGVKSEMPNMHMATALGQLGEAAEKAELAELEGILVSTPPASGGHDWQAQPLAGGWPCSW